MSIDPNELRQLAIEGIREKIARLNTILDELSSPSKPGPKRKVQALTIMDSPAVPARTRKRKPMSAAAKKAVAERMKKYWAERRKAAKKD